MKTIALFGGTFDPPHLGHLSIVKAALSCLDVDKVIVMPAFLNPFKSKVHAPPELRLKWLKKIFSVYDDVEVDDFELACKRKVPSLETVRHLKKRYEKIYLVIGADNLKSLDRWYGYDELKKLVTFVVASRDDIDIPSGYILLHVDEPVSSTSLREKTKKEFLPVEIAGEIEKFYKENNG
ncbi:nicotinate (nicotinamide) nucleotide adenylyltransferase [Sulfurimonas sp. HSL-1716]|uniref:nicotinate (nicotinamide) nucleotide adenylyltransferase n=1 Tax=Hydrocurvibacter sulfurireducens TaxID=3131937 RepID=UPI0031F8F3B8